MHHEPHNNERDLSLRPKFVPPPDNLPVEPEPEPALRPGQEGPDREKESRRDVRFGSFSFTASALARFRQILDSASPSPVALSNERLRQAAENLLYAHAILLQIEQAEQRRLGPRKSTA